MLINVLIRTSYRPDLFKRCLDSVKRQTHFPIRIIVGYDRKEALSYIPEDVEKVEMKPETGKFFYNKYCNELKDLVTGGWFFFLDDDDNLIHYKILSEVTKHLHEGATVVQFVRNNGRAKPILAMIEAKQIVCGYVGLPVLFLHYKFKNVADLDGEHEFGDYLWIKKVTSQVKTNFVPLPVVVAERRSWGKVYLNQTA